MVCRTVSDVVSVPNPFNAGFGVAPPYVAGRSALVHRVLANLQDGVDGAVE